MDTTYAVYTMTPKGSFSQKYEGTSEEEALKAYNKLVDAKKPRSFLKTEAGKAATAVMVGGGFPED